jgi:hypothetical protein
VIPWLQYFVDIIVLITFVPGLFGASFTHNDIPWQRERSLVFDLQRREFDELRILLDQLWMKLAHCLLEYELC